MLCSNKLLVHEFIFCVSVKINPTIFIISHFSSFNHYSNVYFKTIYHTVVLLDWQQFIFAQTQSQQFGHVS
jgi:hypothetical protein